MPCRIGVSTKKGAAAPTSPISTFSVAFVVFNPNPAPKRGFVVMFSWTFSVVSGNELNLALTSNSDEVILSLFAGEAISLELYL